MRRPPKLPPNDPAFDTWRPIKTAPKLLTLQLGGGWSESELRRKIKRGELLPGVHYVRTPKATAINISAIVRWIVQKNLS